MFPKESTGFEEAFSASLQRLVLSGRSVPPILSKHSPHSSFGDNLGNNLVETVSWQTRIDPRNPFLANPVRSIWIDQALGMALWNLTASSDLASVAFYNANAARFSEDGQQLRAPWGARLLKGGMNSPFFRALELLDLDPSSLRAVVPVYSIEDLGVSSRDVPCLLNLQLLSREGQLDFYCHLRSLNPYWVWPYDHVFLSFLLAFAARKSGLTIGTISYFTTSLQARETELSLFRRAVEVAPSIDVGQEMHPLLIVPRDIDDTLWARLASAEKQLKKLLTDALTTKSAEAVRYFVETMNDQWIKLFFGVLAAAYLDRHCREAFGTLGPSGAMDVYLKLKAQKHVERVERVER